VDVEGEEYEWCFMHCVRLCVKCLDVEGEECEWCFMQCVRLCVPMQTETFIVMFMWFLINMLIAITNFVENYECIILLQVKNGCTVWDNLCALLLESWTFNRQAIFGTVNRSLGLTNYSVWLSVTHAH
jgi:hypothetical protein